MIAFLSGKIKNKKAGYIVLEINGVGYKVFITSIFFADLIIGQTVDLYTYQYVREDALSLYGFKSQEELELFELLLSISGIGPKSAMGVLSMASVEDIKEAIVVGDSALLTKVSGIGKKTVERIILELREKISKMNIVDENIIALRANSDEIDALLSLGYSLSQSRQALQAVDPEIKESSERIRQALKQINR
ncbi:MAG: Holliday junction branch migration protein RuvA [Patescibacteria group bacterium]|nr:Holliday junction branch migration protein RuvA [Patescibacteria group bacterium]MBU1870750.1 Holliday junction branch migration protein RuvA [Patescibacteria group bacterium]